MLAPGVTVKPEELSPVPPPLLTVIFPVVAPDGTVARSCASESTIKLAAVLLLNAMLVAPVKPVPVRATSAPTGPLVGVNEIMVGGGVVVVKVKSVDMARFPVAFLDLTR